MFSLTEPTTSAPINRPKLQEVFDGMALESEHINQFVRAIKDIYSHMLPCKTIVKCEYCGTWGIAGFSCTQCGAPIDYGELIEYARHPEP